MLAPLTSPRLSYPAARPRLETCAVKTPEPKQAPLDPRFFANADKQALAPAAFALQPAAQPFLQAHDSTRDRVALTAAILAEPGLASSVANFDKLTWGERIPVVNQVFNLECQTLGITPPQLIISDTAIPGPAFFEFNLQSPDPGKVYLNPTALAREKDGFAGLLLLVHETRHSAQFQHAFLSGSDDPLATGYRAAFQAQKDLAGKLSFVDFCSLLNEFEAFQFANSVVGSLTGGRADTSGMGTLASQFGPDGKLRVDLRQLAAEVGPAGVLDAFNQLERPHYDQLHGRTRKTCC